MLRPPCCPRLDLAPSRERRGRLMVAAEAPESGPVCHGTAAPGSATVISRPFAFMLGLTNTATNRTYLRKEQRKPVAVDIAVPARFVLSLFLVFALAKLLVTAHRHLPGSPWIAFAFLG